jgi:hypothetical protein
MAGNPGAALAYLQPSVLANLEKYAGYECCLDESITTPFLRPLWISFATKLAPVKPAVPLLAAFGLLVLSSAILMAATTQQETQKPSAWMFAFCGLSGLLYQATSAVESERARDSKTKETAMDVMIWQGLNSYSAGLFVLNATMALVPDDPRWVFLALVLGYTTSYTVHWQKYVSGRRKLVSKRLDVTEIQLALSVVLIVTAVAGTEIWSVGIPALDGWQLNHVLLYFLAARAGLNIMRYFNIILEGGPGEEGMTAADTAVLSPGPPVLLALLVARQMYRSATFDEVPYTSVVGVGIMFAKITNKLVIAEVSRSPVDQLDVLFWPIGGLFALECLGFELNHTILTDGYVIFAIINLTLYNFNVLKEIKVYLNVTVFTGPPKPPKPAKKAE